MSASVIPAQSTDAPSPEETRAIATEAVVYGFPLVDNCRVQYSYFVDESNPEFKALYNTLFNIPRVYTPDDKAIQTPNSDTPYSWIGLDLRAEPIVFTVPSINQDRYWSLQLVDLYTHNFDYLGSRTTGNDGGSYAIAGPDWIGEMPPGVDKVIRCETSIASAQFRTQLFDPADLDNVRKLQAQYTARPLSSFLGNPAPAPATPINFPKPLDPDEQKTSIEFFRQLDFGLQFCPVHPSETELRARLARLGVAGNGEFNPFDLSPEIQDAMQQGMADGWSAFERFKEVEVDTGKRTAGEAFGTRNFLKNDYMARMAGAVLGIYGNSKEEALYPAYYVDADASPLDGNHDYRLRFAPEQLPPVNSFWSLTMYELPASLLYANPIDRYLINSPMLPKLKRDDQGGVTIYIQNHSPGGELESNWLPAPRGPFWATLRLYWPKDEALDGRWKQPPLERTN